MLVRFRRLLAPPALEDRDLNRRARLLHIILLGLITFTTVLLIIYLSVESLNRFGRTLVFLALLVELISFGILQGGNVKWAGRLLVYLLWAALMISTLTSDGVQGTPILGQVLLIFMGGLLIGEPLAFTLGLLTIAGNYVAMLMEVGNVLPFADTRLSLSAYWAVQSSYLLLALGLMLLIGRSMRANLREANQSEQVLRERVKELRQAQTQLEMSDQNLHRREAILEAVRVAAEKLFRGRSFWESAEYVLKDLGMATGVDRVYLFENHREATGNLVTSQRSEWVAEGVRAQIDNPGLQSFSFEKAGFDRWPKTLGNNKVLKGHVKDFPDSERILLSELGMLSVLVVPIFLGEEWWGFIGFDETKWEREWSPAEEDALRGAGGILGGAIERRRTEKALNQSEARYLGILQDQFDLICRYTPDGHLIFGNESYTRFYGIDREKMTNMAIWTQVLPERLEGLRAKIASLTPKEPVAVSQSINRRGDGVNRWIEWTERGIFDENGRLVEIQAVGRDIDEELGLRKQLEENMIQIETQAMTDGLTGLLNRRAVMEHAEAEWQRAAREKRPLSLAMMDLDRLKEINDTFGHLVGDQALAQLAALTRGSMRRYDWVGRWGGDEFLLILPGTGKQEATEVADRLRIRFKQQKVVLKKGQEIELHVSLGVATQISIQPSDSLHNLLARADQALYLAKQAGRDRVAVAD